MKKAKFLLIALILMLVVSACQIEETTPPPIESTDSEVETPDPELEDVEIVPTEDLPLLGEDGRMACTLVGPLFPELTPEQKEQLSIFPEVTEDDHVKGPEDAMLTIIEYTDFFCPYCGMAFQALEDVVEKYPNDVRIVYRALPLESLHPTAPLAAQAAEAAGMQGKFWEMYEAIFSNQATLAPMTADELKEDLTARAEEMGLDVDQFVEDMESQEVVDKIAKGAEAMFAAGVSSTPTVLANGRPLGDWRGNYLSNIIEVMKAEEQMAGECPEWVIDQTKTYTATIKTKDGDMVLELYADVAPLAVNSFVYLARSGFYDGVTFHRVYHTFMAQAGDPTGTGWSGAGYQYREEISPDLTFDEPYMLGVAKSSMPGTSGSQFFITYVPYPSLNGGYTIFGKLIDGIDVFEKITERDADNNPEAPRGDEIISIVIDEK
jgi:cyclophilin family peptidyl-prolyl cis-trans isomerase/protein-disulfide isomerase